jgi:protease I
MNTQKPVAILVHEGYQDLEFWYPLLRLREEGKPVTVIAAEPDKTYFSQLEYPVIADIGIGGAKGADYAGVLVPGGQSAKFIAEEPRMQAFIKEAAAAGAFLASISEGTNAIKVKGKREVKAAGTNDLPEFCKSLLAAIQ